MSQCRNIRSSIVPWMSPPQPSFQLLLHACRELNRYNGTRQGFNIHLQGCHPQRKIMSKIISQASKEKSQDGIKDCDIWKHACWLSNLKFSFWAFMNHAFKSFFTTTRRKWIFFIQTQETCDYTIVTGCLSQDFEEYQLLWKLEIYEMQ